TGGRGGGAGALGGGAGPRERRAAPGGGGRPAPAPRTGARRNADLFLAALLGEPVARGPRSGEAIGEDHPAVAPPSCARDVAITETAALLITNNAPLPVTRDETARVARDSGARDD